MKNEFERFGGGFKAKRGEIEPIILEMLIDSPKHGYELISSIEEKSNGLWKPSAGSVYPTLTLLEEKGLVESKESDGKKTYNLTSEGVKEAGKARRNNESFWKRTSKMHSKHFKYRMQIIQIMHTIRSIGDTQDEEKIAKLNKVFEELKEKLDNILYGEEK